MKRRYRYSLNLLSLGLLLFALYLNFIKKDAADVSTPFNGSNITTPFLGPKSDGKTVSLNPTSVGH